MDQNKEDVKEKTKVQILFRNGSVLNLEVSELKVTANGERVTRLTWDNANPGIMFISLPDIITVLEIRD